jgi:hypothetical protein
MECTLVDSAGIGYTYMTYRREYMTDPEEQALAIERFF